MAPNPQGTPIWYELITTDLDGARRFYGDVVGWTIAHGGMSGLDYHIATAADGQGIAGLMPRPPGMEAPPTWIFYLGVDDVDASVERIVAGGGSVHMPAMTLDGVGRMAMVADPQGGTFYVMRGASDEPSTAYDRNAMGHGSWHELVTTDPAGAFAFYGEQFGFAPDGAMPMGPDAEYAFIQHDGQMIGAVMPTGQMCDGGWQHDAAARPHWHFYFSVDEIEAAKARVLAGGGQVVHGPMEVPGGDWAMNCLDPQGVAFGLVAPAKG